MKLTVFGKVMMAVLGITCAVLFAVSWAMVAGGIRRDLGIVWIVSLAVALLLEIAFETERRRHE